jgi:DNA-nicking Smr family endonuclease
MARRAGLTDADRAAWADYASHVIPLPGRVRPARTPEPAAAALPAEPAAPGAASAARHRPPARAMPGLCVGDQTPGVDNATWRRLRTGQLPAARRLDLHGYTAQRAFLALSHFLKVAHADHVRCVEVITGRGATEGGGVLRRELPLWLNLPDLRPMVLAVTHPHPGNPGSVRLLLRRPRS